MWLLEPFEFSYNLFITIPNYNNDLFIFDDSFCLSPSNWFIFWFSLPAKSIKLNLEFLTILILPSSNVLCNFNINIECDLLDSSFILVSAIVLSFNPGMINLYPSDKQFISYSLNPSNIIPLLFSNILISYLSFIKSYIFSLYISTNEHLRILSVFDISNLLNIYSRTLEINPLSVYIS